MTPSPPRLLELIVGILIPPASREHVLGDLHERFESTPRYILDAIHTIPLVILSRIRRTADPQVLLMEAFALYTSFVLAAWRSAGIEFFEDQSGYLRLAAPAAITLLALVLIDAYADPRKRSPLRPILSAALAIALAFLSQTILAAGDPALAIPRWILIPGAAMALLLLSTLRMLFPPIADLPQTAGLPAFWQKLSSDHATKNKSRRIPEGAIFLAIAAAIILLYAAAQLRNR